MQCQAEHRDAWPMTASKVETATKIHSIGASALTRSVSACDPLISFLLGSCGLLVLSMGRDERLLTLWRRYIRVIQYSSVCGRLCARTRHRARVSAEVRIHLLVDEDAP